MQQQITTKSESSHQSSQQVGTPVSTLASADEVAATQPATPNVSAATNAIAARQSEPTENEIALGKWVHKHRRATEGVGGFLGYQIIRNALAAIPYGVATAAVWLTGEKLAEKSLMKANPGWNPADAKTKDLLKHTTNTAALVRSPLRDVVMIATGFTLFRGTLKVVRYMKERLFDPNHTEEQSIREVQQFGEHLKDTLKEVTPAEVASTPAAAIALGIGRRFYDPQKALGTNFDTHSVTGVFRQAFKTAKHGQTPLQRVANVFSSKGGYLKEALITATSFVPFFELGDRRYKDAQVARGIWLNDPTSLVRKSDEQAQAELKAGEAYIKASAPNATASVADEMARKSAESLHATGHLRPTDAPTFSCFAMRRVVPTFMGIGAYVAGKRLAYLGMGTIPENYNASKKGFGGFLSNLGKIALIEGAATSLFWLNSSVIDKFEPWYDKTFKDSQPKPLTDQEIRKHYLELQAKLDAKEQERKGGVTSVA